MFVPFQTVLYARTNSRDSNDQLTSPFQKSVLIVRLHLVFKFVHNLYVLYISLSDSLYLDLYIIIQW